MGDLSKALGFPNGPIPGSGRVTVTGSEPRTLVVPRHRFRTSPFAGIPLWPGTVIVQQTAGTHGDDLFTIMGSDARTPLGAGNISTVAGGISFRNSLSGQTPFATWHKVWMTLSPPVPSLSPAGVAAAAALILLAVGYALQRRSGGRAPTA